MISIPLRAVAGVLAKRDRYTVADPRRFNVIVSVGDQEETVHATA